MKVGAAIGTALFPGAGSIAGVAVGFVIGVGLSVVLSDGFDNWYDDQVNPRIDSFIKGTGDFIGGIF